MEKTTQLQDMLKLQETIALAREKQKNKVIPIVEEKIEEAPKEVEHALPSTYISANQLKLSAKDLTHTVSYLDRLRQTDERYEAVKIESDKAEKIKRKLIRLTTGSVSVAPIKCTGSSCSFSSTCLTGDTKILMKNGAYKTIKNIKIGDLVYSFDTRSKSIELDVVYNAMCTGVRTVYKIITKYGNIIKATEDHLFLTGSKGKVWNCIKDGLTTGDPLIVDDFDPLYSDEIESYGDLYIDYIEYIIKGEEEKVYDISVKKNANFIANNIVAHNCPYFLENVAPVGLQCLVELQLIEYWMEKYQQEFNIADDSITDMHMISRLCEYDIYDMRVSRYLSESDPTLLTDFIVSTDEQRIISNKAVSAAFEVKERIDKLRSKTLKELMATREAKAKLIPTIVQAENNVTLAQLKEKYDNLIREKTSPRFVNNG